MIPVLVPRRQLLAANGDLHADAQRGVRGRVRAARPAGRQGRRPAGGHPRRRRAVLPGRGLLLHAAGIAAAARRRRGAPRRARRRGGRARRSGRPSPSCARASPSSAPIARSAGRSSTSGSRRRSSACSACSVRPSPSRRSGSRPKDFAVVVLPLGFGIVTGILLLNSYGTLLPAPPGHRGRADRARHPAGGAVGGRTDQPPPPAGGRSRAASTCPRVTSLLAVVVVIAFFAGIAYGLVAIPSQTQLQEDLPEDVRGRVFGVLGMLVSVASFLPIIIVGPISDLVGTTAVIFVMAIGVMIIGFVSVVDARHSSRKPEARRGSIRARPTPSPSPESERASGPWRPAHDPAEPPLEPVGVPGPSSPAHDARRPAGPSAPARPTRPTATRRSDGARRGRVHRRDDQHRLRPGRPAATSRPSTAPRSSPGRPAWTRSPTSSRSIAAGRPPATSRSRSCSTSPATLRTALADPSIDGAVVVQGTDTIEETALLLGPRPRRPEAGRRDRRDAGIGRARLRRPGQPARRGPGRGRIGVDARRRRRRLPRRHDRARG